MHLFNDERFVKNRQKQQKYDDCMRIWLGNEEKEEKRLRKSDDDDRRRKKQRQEIEKD